MNATLDYLTPACLAAISQELSACRADLPASAAEFLRMVDERLVSLVGEDEADAMRGEWMGIALGTNE